MLYVEGLKHNLLCVSQIRDNGYDVTFQSKDCEICNVKDGKMVGKEIKTHNNVYVFDDSRVSYYLSKTNEAQLSYEFWQSDKGQQAGSCARISKTIKSW